MLSSRPVRLEEKALRQAQYGRSNPVSAPHLCDAG
jgi:hypothetical protein